MCFSPQYRSAYFQKDPALAAITLWPSPPEGIDDGLTIRAAFEPTKTATTLADVLYDYYLHEISAGAIAYLLQLPGQSFSNPMAAQGFSARFTSGLLKTRAMVPFGRVSRVSRVQPRAFA